MINLESTSGTNKLFNILALLIIKYSVIKVLIPQHLHQWMCKFFDWVFVWRKSINSHKYHNQIFHIYFTMRANKNFINSYKNFFFFIFFNHQLIKCQAMIVCLGTFVLSWDVFFFAKGNFSGDCYSDISYC